MKMSNIVKLLCLMLCIVCAQSVIVRNGVYDNLVIEIQKDVSDEDCSRFLAALEVSFEDFLLFLGGLKRQWGYILTRLM